MKKQQYLENYWRFIFIPVRIQGISGKLTAFNFLLDTGCGKTQMSHETATELGYGAIHGTKYATVTSMAGQIYGYQLNLARLSVFDKTFKNYEVDVFDIAITESNDEEIDGLIGMDIVSRFKLLIDGPKHRLQVRKQ